MLPTLKLNDKNVSVQIAQLLTSYVLDNGEFTEDFKAHITAWQQKHGLTADGIIGAATWRALASNAPLVSRKTLKSSRYAKAVQLLVGADPDGIFGRKTKDAVEAFQKNAGLKADGIVGGDTWRALITGESGGKTDFVQPPNFKQYDSRWGKKMYSNHNDPKQTMASSACGPTSMADIVAHWWDSNITPYDLALLSMAWGTRTYDSGTTSAFLKKCAAKYNGKYNTASSLDKVRACLDAGGLVIVCFGAGTKGKAGYQKWTKGGHYCVIWGYSGDTYFINDPASASSARAKGTATEISNTRKGYYLFQR